MQIVSAAVYPEFCYESHISKECAKRWRHFLDPDLDHSQWGPEDDARLWAAVLDYGTNWRKVVEEEFPERSPTNVKNRWVLRSTNRCSTPDDSELSYAVIKNLRRRAKNLAATTASDEVAEAVEATTSLSTKAANNGCQVTSSSNSNKSAARPNTPMSFGNAVYSGGATDDDFAFLLHDSSTPQTPYSSTGMESLTDANGSTSRFSPDSQSTTLAPSSTLRMQHCSKATTPSTDDHMPDGTEHGSLVLDDFPQLELGIRNDFGDEAHNELWWEPQNDSVGNGWMPSAMEGLVADTSSSSCSVHASSEARRVSLFLEDMQPETANRVTTMLLNGNVDLKMKMTIR